VDLNNKECEYNQWHISGIPCVHAIAAIYDHRNNTEYFVDPKFYKDSYLKA